MPCPHCATTATTEQPRRTALGYRTFRCRACRRIFNERTGTSFNHLQYPTDLVLLVVLWRLRYKLSLRDLAEMFLERGFVFSHEAVRDWEARYAPLLTARLRAKRRGQGGTKWHVDETYIKVNGQWCYLYRAIDREGNLVDARLSATRDMAAAQQSFRQALALAGDAPEQVTTDGHDAYPRAIREILGPGVRHRTSRYKNNRIEQEPRREATLLSHARLRQLRVRRTLLFGLRGAASVLPRPGPAGRASLARGATAAVPGSVGGSPG